MLPNARSIDSWLKKKQSNVYVDQFDRTVVFPIPSTIDAPDPLHPKGTFILVRINILPTNERQDKQEIPNPHDTITLRSSHDDALVRTAKVIDIVSPVRVGTRVALVEIVFDQT